MATASYVRGDFTGGEISKFAQGRYDLPSYPKSLNVCLNALPNESGGWMRRPGTRFIAQTFGGQKGRLISFAFKNNLPYTFEFTNTTLRAFAAVNVTAGISLAYTNDPQVVASISTANPCVVTTTNNHGWATGDHFQFTGTGTSVAPLQNREFVGTITGLNTLTLQDQVTGDSIDGSTLGAIPAGLTINRIFKQGSPYTTAQLAAIRKVQAETTAVFLHPAVVPYTISVNTQPSGLTFATFTTLQPASILDGPYLDQYKGTTITPTGVSGSITLQTGGAAFPGFQPADAGRMIRLFSQPAQWNGATAYVPGNVVSLFVDPLGQPGVATYFACILNSTGHAPSLTPTEWQPAVSGTGGTNNAVSGFSNSVPGLAAGKETVIATSQAGGSVATWTWGTITAVNSASNVTVTVNGPALIYNSTVIYAWRLGLYGGANGSPTCGVYHDGRLWLGGALGNRFDASCANDIFNFAPTAADGTVGAGNAIAGVCNAEDVNPILAMQSHQQGVIAITQPAEWLLFAPTAGSIAPNNISARRVTKIGGLNVEAIAGEHTILFVQRYGRKIVEYFADVFSGKFSAPNLTWLSKHLTKGGIQEIAYQQELVPTVWARVSNKLVGWVYKRETLVSAQPPTISAGHRHVLGSGRTIESIVTGPSVGGTTDSLMMITNDPLTNVRYVEALSDMPDEGETLLDAQYVDCAIAPAWVLAAPSGSLPYGGMVFSGLWAQNGKTVSAWIGGLDCGDFQVINGSITVPFGDGLSAGTGTGLLTQSYVASIPTIPIWVGFTYTSDGQLVRPNTPQETGARNGPGFMKLRRTNWWGFQVEGAVTNSISFGTDFSSLTPMKFKSPGGKAYNVLQQFTGIYRDTGSDSDSFDSMICWRVTRPYPANIAAVGAALDTKDI